MLQGGPPGRQLPPASRSTNSGAHGSGRPAGRPCHRTPSSRWCSLWRGGSSGGSWARHVQTSTSTLEPRPDARQALPRAGLRRRPPAASLRLVCGLAVLLDGEAVDVQEVADLSNHHQPVVEVADLQRSTSPTEPTCRCSACGREAYAGFRHAPLFFGAPNAPPPSSRRVCVCGGGLCAHRHEREQCSSGLEGVEPVKTAVQRTKGQLSNQPPGWRAGQGRRGGEEQGRVQGRRVAGAHRQGGPATSWAMALSCRARKRACSCPSRGGGGGGCWNGVGARPPQLLCQGTHR